MPKHKVKPYRGKDGLLTIKKNNRPHKFCAICGLKMLGNRDRLGNHFSGHHKGETPEFNEFDKRPRNPMYTNWDEWIKDPNIDLKEDQDVRDKLTG